MQERLSPVAEPETAPVRRRWLPRWRWHNVVRLLRRVGHSFAKPEHQPTPREMQRLLRAERRGLQLSILCRTLVFGVALVWYVGSLLLSNSHPTLLGLCTVALLTGIGVAHFIIIGTRFDAPWIKFAAAAIDMMAICSLFLLIPVSQSDDVPQIFAFRSTSGIILMPFIALTALSLSPRLTIWGGVWAAASWLTVFRITAVQVEDAVSWSDITTGAGRADYEAVFLSPNFIGSGTIYTECIVLLVTALILALAVARARRVFFAQIEAEAAEAAERARRNEIAQRLGRFVPASVAEKLIDDPSALEPQVRHGAALVMDVENFTAFAQNRDPADVITELNRFLAQCAEAVGEVNGVVIAFTGDGLLATFNTPLEVARPEGEALKAAAALSACGASHGFRLRVGIAAGPIAAGSVGSVERQAFTVYGDTVNRAARLEALAKELGEAVLVDEACFKAGDAPFESMGEHRLAGFSGAVRVWRPERATVH